MARLTWCPTCHTRHRDGSKKCVSCGRRTRWVAACERCGHRFVSNNINRHRDWCASVPRPEAMADMLDKDQELTVGKLRLNYHARPDTIIRHLGGTRWTEKRLLKRGKVVWLNSVKQSWGKEGGHPTTPCARCMILGDSADLDQDGLCVDCRYELVHSFQRLREAVSGYGTWRGHILNGWDLGYLTKQIVS